MMNLLEVEQTSTSTLMLAFMPTKKFYIALGADFAEIQQEIRYEHATANIDLASMHSLGESQFIVRFIRAYDDLANKSELVGDRVDTIFENPSKNKKLNDPNTRNFEIVIYLQEERFRQLYDLYLAKIRPELFNCYINLDLNRDHFKYLGKAINGIENYLLNDIRDEQNFGCKFKISSYILGAMESD